jgi:HEAT repeat protein
MVKRKRPFRDAAALLRDLDAQATFVRRRAIIELVEHDARDCGQALQMLLFDQEASIRACAAWALGELGQPQAAGPLMLCLKDMDVDVRRAAAQSLAQMSQPGCEAALQVASVDADRWVAEWARRGLARLQNGAKLQRPRKSPKSSRKSLAQDEGRA